MILRKIFIFVGFVLILGCGGQGAEQPAADVNPFFVEYDTPFNVQPFDRIEEAHFVPAFEEGMARAERRDRGHRGQPRGADV